jgi:hypothetical protein
MISQKMLLTMYEYSYFLVNQGIGDITREESLFVPEGISNPANWILGHIITSRCNVLAMLKVDPPWDFQKCKPYIPDSKPLTSEDDVENFESMKKDLEKSHNLLIEAINNITENKLGEQNGDNTIAEDLAGYAIHEANHAGELALLEKILHSR